VQKTTIKPFFKDTYESLKKLLIKSYQDITKFDLTNISDIQTEKITKYRISYKSKFV
jgi:hypothetical protein